MCRSLYCIKHLCGILAKDSAAEDGYFAQFSWNANWNEMVVLSDSRIGFFCWSTMRDKIQTRESMRNFQITLKQNSFNFLFK